MTGVFATPADLAARWADMHNHISDETAGVLLSDASLWLLTLYPSIGLDPAPNVRGVVTMVVCSMVRRAANAGDLEGLSSIADAAGPFNTTYQAANPNQNFYLTQQEKTLLEAALTGVGSSGFRCIDAEGW